MRVTIVAGARPNFMKIAPIMNCIHLVQKNHNISVRLVHTGQHYDKKMSEDFFEQLGIPEPDVNLNAGSGSQAEQTAAIMVKFEQELNGNRPDVVLVVGDVTSTMACAITAKKQGVDVVHVEAGIRSGDMSMPEEVNRIVTDAICDHFFTTSEFANHNLIGSGVKKSKISFVGNTMIDTLYQNLNRLMQPEIWNKMNLAPGRYFLVTLHRPSNVDDAFALKRILDVIVENVDGMPIVFPVHPRTKKVLDAMQYSNRNLVQAAPMSYLEFIYLLKNAMAVITDSGGITEEATVLKVPCMTLRNSTERPETVTIGTNELIGTEPEALLPYLNRLKGNQWKPSGIPAMWDGKAAERIVAKLIDLYPEQEQGSVHTLRQKPALTQFL